ncbi:MAG: arylformamidase [Pseudomonadota bacterium]
MAKQASDIIDISQVIHPGIPVWPGDTPFSIEETWSMSDDCPVLVSKMTLSTQTGTHADSHSHYEKNGVDAADRDLMPYVGPCTVIDVSAGRGPVRADEVLPALDELGDSPRVLLRTFVEFPTTEWRSDFRPLSAEMITALGERGAQLIGTDAPSVDPEDSKTLDAHHAVHNYDMAILEGLVLDHVSPGRYELIALPLPIVAADASPVRAVLRTLPEPTAPHE